MGTVSHRSARSSLLVLAASLALPLAANAQSIPKEKGPTRIVALFNFLCLKHLPDLDGVERAAGFGEFDQLLGEDLAPYMPDVPVETIVGWRYHDHGDEFILTAMRAKADDDAVREAPGLAGATETRCALRVPNNAPQPLLGELTRVMGRAADKAWLDGRMRVYAWTHQQTGALSHVHYYVPENAGAKAVLDASVLLKK